MKPSIAIKDGALEVGLDTNGDGQNVVDLKLNISEAVSEAIAKGTAIEGHKVVNLKFEGTKLVIDIDSDKDGEPLLDVVVDLGEAFDEISGLVLKK